MEKNKRRNVKNSPKFIKKLWGEGVGCRRGGGDRGAKVGVVRVAHFCCTNNLILARRICFLQDSCKSDMFVASLLQDT